MTATSPSHTSKFKVRLGRLIFWPLWPLFWLYLYKSNRSRILVVAGRQGLVVKDWLSDGLWIVPGGGIRPAETPQQGAARELQEEVGLKVSPQQLKSLGESQYRQNGFNYHCHIFYVEFDNLPPINRLAKELAGYQWLDLHQSLPGCDPLVSLIVGRWKDQV